MILQTIQIIEMLTMTMILREWLTLSQPGPQPDDPLDPPGKDAPRVPHEEYNDDDDDWKFC